MSTPIHAHCNDYIKGSQHNIPKDSSFSVLANEDINHGQGQVGSKAECVNVTPSGN